MHSAKILAAAGRLSTFGMVAIPPVSTSMWASKRGLAASTTSIVYRMARTRDMDQLLKLAKDGIGKDPHFQGVGGTPEEASPLLEYRIRDALRHKYSFVAVEGQSNQVVGCSLITVRNRDPNLDGLRVLGEVPIVNYSAITNIINHCCERFFADNPKAYRVCLSTLMFAEQEYLGVGLRATMLAEQYSRMKKLIKQGENIDGMIAVVMGPESQATLEGLGYKPIFQATSSMYVRADGSRWNPTDPKFPYAMTMYLQF